MRKKITAISFIATILNILIIDSIAMAVSDKFPLEAFNGMTINYTINGIKIDSSEDEDGFTKTRYLKGNVSSEKVSVSASSVNPSIGKSTLTIQIIVDGNVTEDKFIAYKEKQSMKLDLNAVVPKGAFCEVVISQSSFYGNGETRGLEINGQFKGIGGSEGAVSNINQISDESDSDGDSLLPILGASSLIGAGVAFGLKKLFPKGKSKQAEKAMKRLINKNVRKPNEQLLKKYNTTEDKLKDATKDTSNRNMKEKELWDNLEKDLASDQLVLELTVATTDVTIDGLANITGQYGKIVRVSYNMGKNIFSNLAEHGLTQEALEAGTITGLSDTVNDFINPNKKFKLGKYKIKYKYVKAALTTTTETISTLKTEGASLENLGKGLLKGTYQASVEVLADSFVGDKKGYGGNVLNTRTYGNKFGLTKELSDQVLGKSIGNMLNKNGLKPLKYSLDSKLSNHITGKLKRQGRETAKRFVVNYLATAEVKTRLLGDTPSLSYLSNNN